MSMKQSTEGTVMERRTVGVTSTCQRDKKERNTMRKEGHREQEMKAEMSKGRVFERRRKYE